MKSKHTILFLLMIFICGSQVIPNFSQRDDSEIKKDSNFFKKTTIRSSLGSLNYSSYLGYSASDYIYEIQVDEAGYIYLSIQTTSPDFPTSNNAFDRTFNGGLDLGIIKLSPDGKNIVFATFIGGSDDEGAMDMRVLPSGDIILVGYTHSNDFPVNSSAFDQTFNGNKDLFVTKLSADGTSLIYSTYIGGSQGDYYYGMDIDEHENVLLTGNTWSSNFPITGSAYDSSFGGVADCFITKLNATGENLIYSSFLGGSLSDSGRDIIATGNETLMLCGVSQTTTLPVTPGAFQQNIGGNADCFLTKINISSNTFEFLTYLGGEEDEKEELHISIDNYNNIWVTGTTYSSDFPTTNRAYNQTYGGLGDVFLSKFNANASTLLSSTFLGGKGLEKVTELNAINSNNIFLTGYTQSSDFPASDHPYDGTLGGTQDGFVSIFSSNGNTLLNSTLIGGSENEIVTGLYLSDSQLYLIGQTFSSDFPTTPLCNDSSLAGDYDGFLMLFDHPFIPAEPVLESLNPSTTGNFILTWTPVSGATSYNIYRYSNPIFVLNSSVTKIAKTSLSSFNESISENGSYYYAVTATNASGESEISNCINVTVLIDSITINSTLPKPPNLYSIVTPNHNGSIILRWDGVDEADSYNIYRGGFDQFILNSSTLIELNFEGLLFLDTISQNGTYYYAVTAINASGESNASTYHFVSVFLEQDPLPANANRFGITYPIKTETNIFACYDQGNKKILDAIIVAEVTNSIVFHQYQVNPTAFTIPENTTKTHFYYFELEDPSVSPKSFSVNFMFFSEDYTDEELEFAKVYYLNGSEWIREHMTSKPENQLVYIQQARFNTYYLVGINPMDLSDSQDYSKVNFSIGGFHPIVLVGLIAITMQVLLQKQTIKGERARNE
ncbi:SBBP repeat-containing protein [Candidatus Lokiarchaeum ossiferum]|uniref:SBBP repeat-containing protein n=1 Tax=Candidatus Lokiarchaeum ossiferum TaxID=2951803 RepID=UPI00352E80D9